MRTVLIHTVPWMDALAKPDDTLLAPGSMSLGTLLPKTVAVVRGVGKSVGDATPVERRLIELGFVPGERVEVLTQTRPGGDPFVIRVGDTTFALRRREVATVWVDVTQPERQP